MVINSSRLGKILNFISLDNIGLPVLKKDNNNPSKLINAPPIPTNENADFITP
jgi:hypothetical protein